MYVVYLRMWRRLCLPRNAKKQGQAFHSHSSFPLRNMPTKVQKKSKGVQSKARTKCSPAIWKKFTAIEKKCWTEMYEAFLIPMNFHADWEDKKFKKQQEVTAHNMACDAVWVLQKFGE